MVKSIQRLFPCDQSMVVVVDDRCLKLIIEQMCGFIPQIYSKSNLMISF
jgi:TFIIF-interacting CTD phosphatase-like protein